MRTKLILPLLLAISSVAASQSIVINKSHLLNLVERIDLGGDSVNVVDIYADYPAYRSVEAKGEGFACVDDAARAAVFFIEYNEITHKKDDESTIVGLVNFIQRMQLSDGRFFNFVTRSDGRVGINTNGVTSRASFGWWGARAMWAFGEAALYFKNIDRRIYSNVVHAAELSIPAIDSVLSSYPKLDSAGRPTWLLYHDGADASSELVLGLNKLYEATGDSRFLSLADGFCDGILALQSKADTLPPYSVFLSNHEGWHGWANSQAAALLEFAGLTNRQEVAGRALDEINRFLPHWAGALFFRSCDVNGQKLDYSGQIAYAIRPAVFAAARAFDFTHDPKYKSLAAILASWFFGNNTARTPFYNPENGICFDGTEDSLRVNRNSGAESTVETLLSLLQLKRIGLDSANVKLLSDPSFSSQSYEYEFQGRRVFLHTTGKDFSFSN